MECYEGAAMIKTFRGLMASDTQDTIVLHTNDGSTGYQIVKFELFPRNFGTSDYEAVMQVWKVSQTANTNVVDFSEQTLLAVGAWSGASNVTGEVSGFHVIFDREIFNQDIYITLLDTQSGFMNYYLELEQVKLDLSENTVATLKDIRNLKPQGF